jgi:hypothetical protein
VVGGEGGARRRAGAQLCSRTPRLRPPPPIVRRRTELSKLRGPIEHAGVIYVCEHHESHITPVPGPTACNRHPGSPAREPLKLL